MKKLLFILALISFNASATTLSRNGLWYSHGYEGEQPKYTGMATATAKTIPTAMRGNNGLNYYTWSECARSDDNDTFKIFVGLTDGTKALVHSAVGPKSWKLCDQHDNAAIRVASDGYIWVHKSARGYWRKSYMYKSNVPWDITKGFKVVEADYRAYPQSWSMGLIYTRYNGALREPHVMANSCDKKLVTGGHYNVSLWDGEKLHLFYNYHKDGDLDRRINLYYMYSLNGCDWYNRSGERLDLPLEPDSSLTKIMDTDEASEPYVYLKDVRSDNGKAEALVILSGSNDPLDSAPRNLSVIDVSGNVQYIDEVGHNYNNACFMSDKYIVSPISNQYGYDGGDLHVYSLNGEPLSTIYTKGAANHCKKVVGGNGMIYSDSASTEIESSVSVNVYK